MTTTDFLTTVLKFFSANSVSVLLWAKGIAWVLVGSFTSYLIWFRPRRTIINAQTEDTARKVEIRFAEDMEYQPVDMDEPVVLNEGWMFKTIKGELNYRRTRKQSERSFKLYLKQPWGVQNVAVIRRYLRGDILFIKIEKEILPQAAHLPDNFIVDEMLWFKPKIMVIDSRIKGFKVWQRFFPNYERLIEVKKQDLSGQLAQMPFSPDEKVHIFIERHYSFFERHNIFFNALEFSRVFRIGEKSWWSEDFFKNLISGVLISAILNYAVKIQILKWYDMGIYVLGYVLILFVAPMAAKRIIRIVSVRSDERSDILASSWLKKRSDYKAIEEIRRFFFKAGIGRLMYGFLLFSLIPKEMFIGTWGDGLLWEFKPQTYLWLLILASLIDQALNIFEEKYWEEAVIGAIFSSPEAKKTGFSIIFDVIDDFSTILKNLISITALLLGVWLYGLGWISVGLIMVFIVCYVLSEFNFWLKGFEQDYQIDFARKDFEPRLNNGNLLLDDGVEMDIIRKGNSYENVYPIITNHGTSWLPLDDKFKVNLFFADKPTVSKNKRKWVISYHGRRIAIISRHTGRIQKTFKEESILRDKPVTPQDLIYYSLTIDTDAASIILKRMMFDVDKDEAGTVAELRAKGSNELMIMQYLKDLHAHQRLVEEMMAHCDHLFDKNVLKQTPAGSIYKEGKNYWVDLRVFLDKAAGNNVVEQLYDKTEYMEEYEDPYQVKARMFLGGEVMGLQNPRMNLRELLEKAGGRKLFIGIVGS